MERGTSLNENAPARYDALDQFALQALVDRLFTEFDARVFRILNKYFQGESNE